MTARVLLVDNDRTRVHRIIGPDGRGSVIVKEALGPKAGARIRHERAILRHLGDIAGVARLAEAAAPDDQQLLLEDAGDIVLADLLARGTLPAGELPVIALGLATIVARVHAAGVIHRDINPANILLSAPGHRPVLVDFDLATTFTEVRPGFTHPSEIVGRLPYLAPEQTGRTAVPVDQRADLYGIGATLYELACGRAPFGDGDGDPLRLVRDILARLPDPLEPASGLREIVARLLEKEPDRRYQSAAGLARDLQQLVDTGYPPAQLGQHDFPHRLRAPSVLLGRDAELGALRSALADTALPGARAVLVSGSGGVGKTALIRQLAPQVTERQGWFVTAKHDQFRRDVTFGGVMQALRLLARLLLAESDEELLEHRKRITERLGMNTAAAAGLAPEFAALLGVTMAEGRAGQVGSPAQVHQIALDILCAVAAPERPVVLVVEDLQWASDSGLRFVDAVLTEPELSGLLLVGAYRDQEVDAAHPLTAMRSRWERLGVAPTNLALTNLAPADLSDLVAEVLRLPPEPASRLSRVLAERCAGNPYDTVELINALRRDGVLTLTETGWHWADATIRQHVGDGDVIDLLTGRLAQLPVPTIEHMRTMACLGNEVTLDLFGAAAGSTAAVVYQTLVPALEDGLLGTDAADTFTGSDLVRFRHDRVQQAAYAGLGDEQEGARLAIARRLSKNQRFQAEAAEQYLTVVHLIEDEDERLRAAMLCEAAAADASRVSNHATAERHLRAAVRLRGEVTGWTHIALHATLYQLGRLDEADVAYAAIDVGCAGPTALVDPTVVQIASLTSRGRPHDALALGLEMLARLGLEVPSGNLRDVVQNRLPVLYDWIEQVTAAADLAAAEMSDPRALATSNLINRMSSPAFFIDHDMLGWLVLEAQRLWTEYGPCAALVVPIAHAQFTTIVLRDDYTTGSRMTRHVLTVSERRGYALATAHARFLYTVGGRHWSEALEGNIEQGTLAREGLLTGGDLQHACFAYTPVLNALLDTGRSLDLLESETEAALALAARTGNGTATGLMLTYRQFVRAMRGETAERGAFADDTFDPQQHLVALTGNVLSLAYLHLHQALAAAIYGQTDVLAREAAATTPLLPFIRINAPTIGRLIRAIALASSDPSADEVQEIEDWFAARARDMPGNFRHLLLFIQGERARTAGDGPGAQLAFDAALSELDGRSRPWQRALIAERSAVLHFELGMEWAARNLLVLSRSAYLAWGATEKVRQLDERYPFLRGTAAQQASRTHSTSVSAADIDLIAILRASQTISSETNLDRLHAAVTEQVRAIGGATDVRFLVFADGGWSLLTDRDGCPTIPVAAAAAQGLVPLTVFRYIERTSTSLTVSDLVRDDRFRRDPYLAGVERCSMLAVPIIRQGSTVAMLLLENRLSAGAFTPDRLDAVMLIAGQLAVSVGNALLYRTLEDRVTERTAALRNANHLLETLSLTDALTELANRRHFDEILASTWTRKGPPGESVSVAMIDIDHFKKFNDRYGHPAGDECLRTVAQTIKSGVRDGDIVCRYGGEEFVVVLPGTALAQAVAVGERARVAVANLKLPHAGSDHGTVTISIGVASAARPLTITANALVETADGALYEAKQQGRDQVQAARPGCWRQ
jgi:diguanylate cyclase (GGDEF)-like protein